MRMRRYGWVVAVAFIAMPAVGMDKAPSGKLFRFIKGKQYPICREFNDILRLPQNMSVIPQLHTHPQTVESFYLPPQSNFSFVKWKNLTHEEALSDRYRSEKAIKESEYSLMMAPRNAEQLMPYENKPIRYQTAFIDYDFDGQKEIINRYILPWDKITGTCYFPDTAAERFKKPPSVHDFCNFINYKGRTYLFTHGFDIIIHEISKIQRIGAGSSDAISRVDICRYRF